MGTAEWYRRFADFEAAGSSASYAQIARRIADDAALIERIRALPAEKRQPNLLLAACRYLDAPMAEPTAAVEFLRDQWNAVSEIARVRCTQTNEAARTATFLPLLARMQGPLALIEVGASAGLCLYPDRYRVRYDLGSPIGPEDSPVEINVRTNGPVPVPHRMPEIQFRIGIDRHPLDVADVEDLRWLEACIWPEHTERIARLRSAAQVVSADPPVMVEGDLVEVTGDCLAELPADVTPVVFHSAVLSYVPEAQRVDFIEQLGAHPRTVWLSNEGPGVVENLRTDLVPPPSARSAAYFVLGVDGRHVAGISDPHGSWLRWTPASVVR